jgi:hypothetical protein
METDGIIYCLIERIASCKREGGWGETEKERERHKEG